MYKQKKSIERIVKNLRGKLHEVLSLNHVNYEIGYEGQIYDFSNGTTKEEMEERERRINSFSRSILMNALSDIVDNEFEEDPENLRVDGISAWTLMLYIYKTTPKAKDVASPIVATEIVELKKVAEGASRSKALNLNSIYVQSQRQDWTQEDQEKFILEKEKEND